MVLVWQHGLGSEAIWGIEATGSITVEMPVFVFAFLFGVSMDYQVFIISRMREAYDRTGSTDTAVVEGIGRTGRLVTSAALILGLAFVALSASPGTEVKIFATALAAGILLDATIVRAMPRPGRRGDPRPLELVAAALARTAAQGQALARPRARPPSRRPSAGAQPTRSAGPRALRTARADVRPRRRRALAGTGPALAALPRLAPAAPAVTSSTWRPGRGSSRRSCCGRDSR